MNILVIGINHDNALHAHSDAARMMHYFGDLLHPVTLMKTMPMVVPWQYDLIWVSGEYEVVKGMTINSEQLIVWDCCNMGADLIDSATPNVWAASKGKAWNKPNEGSYFAHAVWEWIKINPAAPLVTDKGFNPRAIAEVRRQVMHDTRTFNNKGGQQEPTAGRMG